MTYGAYKINNKDLYGTFNYIVESGSDGFLGFPKLKPPLSKDWQDQNGKEYDLTNKYFEEKTALLKGSIIASSEVEFWSKHNALFTELSLPGLTTIWIEEFKRSFNVFYTENPDIVRLTRIRISGQNKIAANLSLNFTEPVPGLWSGVVTGDLAYFGAVDAVPTTAAAVIALPNTQPITTQTIMLNTGFSKKVFVFAIPEYSALQTVSDLEEGVNLTFTQNTIVVNGVNYFVYYLVQSVPYLINHPFKISIQNG